MGNKLTAIQVKNAKPGRLADGAGLYLITKPNGKQSWSVRLMVNGKRKEVGLGNADLLGLREARDKAAEMRLNAKATKSLPREDIGQVPTFAQAADAFIEINEGKWRHPKTAKQWRSILARYADHIGDMPVNQVQTRDVVACITPIWHSKPDTAKTLLGRIRQVLSYSIAMGYRPLPNPAAWQDNLIHIMPKLNVDKNHYAAVPVDDAPKVFKMLWDCRDRGNSYRALLFVILGGFRSGEVRNLTFGDLQDEHILIPGHRMKAGQDHRVPLTDRMRSLIPPHVAGTDLIFPGNGNTALSDMSLSKCHRTHQIAATVHGWRSTFADWANGQGFNRDHIDDALAHLVGNKVSRAYRRSDFLEHRRPIMDAWDVYLNHI